MRFAKYLFLFSMIATQALAAPAGPGDLADCQTSPQRVTVGGTDQIQVATNNGQTNLWIENYCSATSQGIVTAESLWINLGAVAAVGTGFELAACGSQVFNLSVPENQSVHIFAATTGHQFACKVNK